MDKLTAMRTFVTVARTGSFSAAAQVLSVPRTRVSQRIQELEAVLLVRLLHRTTRALSLTEEGRIYLPKCEHILEELDGAEQAIASERTDAVGRLRLSCMSIVARSLIIPRLDEFLAAHPRVSVSLSLTDRIVNLQEAGLDCAIRGGQMDDSSLISRHLADCGFGIYAAPALIAEGPPILSPDQLRHLPLVKVVRQRDGLARNWSLSCNGQTMIEDSAARVEMDNDHGALECALGGAGLVLIPHFAAAPHLTSKSLVRVLPDWSAPDRPIYVIYPSRRYVPTKLRVFLDWLSGLM
jgi:LysR family transcriptional regulator, regulator for bpeEF and oprC